MPGPAPLIVCLQLPPWPFNACCHPPKAQPALTHLTRAARQVISHAAHGERLFLSTSGDIYTFNEVQYAKDSDTDGEDGVSDSEGEDGVH